jgi:hypothetical protein
MRQDGCPPEVEEFFADRKVDASLDPPTEASRKNQCARHRALGVQVLVARVLSSSERKKLMYRAILVASLLVVGFIAKSVVQIVNAADYRPEPDCPWPAPPDCEC